MKTGGNTETKTIESIFNTLNLATLHERTRSSKEKEKKREERIMFIVLLILYYIILLLD